MALKKSANAKYKAISLEDKVEINYFILNTVRTYHKYCNRQWGVIICSLEWLFPLKLIFELSRHLWNQLTT